ncbi:MAG: hypothetical protein KC636_10955, partial [Myxococcales bacterium]|nr:hypothetical protein [Myxococcales bacterium]
MALQPRDHALEVERLGLVSGDLGGGLGHHRAHAVGEAELAGELVVDRPKVDRGAAWDGAVERARALVQAKMITARMQTPAWTLDLEAARDGDRDAGFAREDQALADMAATPELLASLYSFDL